MSWGGARAGAGRPAKGPRPSEPHGVRPPVSPWHPVHVTSRVVPGVGALWRRAAYRALRRALELALGRDRFRIVHLGVRRTALELIVEADDKLALARGMQGFQVSAARALNRVAERHGCVFPDRYRMRRLTTRAAVRDAIGRLPASPIRIAWPESALLLAEHAGAGPRLVAPRRPRAEDEPPVIVARVRWEAAAATRASSARAAARRPASG